MRVAILLLALMNALGAQGGHAQRGPITGTVADTSGAPLPYAHVFFRAEEIGSNSGVLTDSTGYFEIRSVPAGARFLVAEFVNSRRDSLRLADLPGPDGLHFRLADEWLGDPFKGPYGLDHGEPEPLAGRLRVGLSETGSQSRAAGGLRVLLMSQQEFPSPGYLLATEVTRFEALTRIRVTGVRSPKLYWRPAYVTPATSDAIIAMPQEGIPDTLEIQHQGRADRYIISVVGAERRLRVEAVQTTSTGLLAGSAERPESETLRFRCSLVQGWLWACEHLRRTIMSSIPNALEGAWDSPHRGWTVLRSARDADIETLMDHARRGTSGPDNRFVTVLVESSDGTTVLCMEGSCGSDLSGGGR